MALPKPDIHGWIHNALAPWALALCDGQQPSCVLVTLRWLRTETKPTFLPPYFHPDSTHPGIPTAQVGVTAHARLRIAQAEAPVLEGLNTITLALVPLLSHEADRGRFTFRWRDRTPHMFVTTHNGGHTIAAVALAGKGKTTPSLAGLAHALNTYASNTV